MSHSANPKVAALVNWTAAGTVLCAMAILFSTPLRSRGSLLSFAEDDFYYYLVIARNLADGLGSTFDGSSLTNGYHPLYFVLLWWVSLFAKSLQSVFGCLAVLDTISALTIFFAARAFFARRLENVWLQNALALFILSKCRIILCGQMEVTLALPLGICFLLMLERAPERISSRRWAAIGLLGSFLVLARLDAALLVFLSGILMISLPKYRASFTQTKVACFFAGFAPLLTLYISINEAVFHRFLPISGAAKQLETTHQFAWHALSISLSRELGQVFVLALVALFLTVRNWQRLATEQRVVYVAALLFPFFHWSLNLFLSDWRLWPWYSYSLLIAQVVGLSVVVGAFAHWYSRPWWKVGEIALFVITLYMVVTRGYFVGSYMVDTANAAQSIRDFAQTHSGRYAMGDRAGMVGYIDGQPTLQTEGLVMDNAYLEHIRRQDSLNEVLKLYKVDFYVSFEEKTANTSRAMADGCYNAKEPVQAGSRSPVLRGVFCQAPVMDYSAPSGHTRIFDLREP